MAPERRFFGKEDWRGFCLTAAVSLAVYLYTLAPEVTLEWSGMYATSAWYASPGPPPGFPVWTLYAWMFTKLLPFGNIAWRVAVSSAVAGALACGVISLIVSRGSATLMEGLEGFKRLSLLEESRLRLMCGVVAGLGFAFHRTFWNLCVIVESAALGMLLFSVVLCLLLRWAYAPERIRYLCAAFFIYGLALDVRVSLAGAAPGLPFVVLFVKPALGRDLFFAMALGLGAALVALKLGWLALWAGTAELVGIWPTYLYLGILCALISMGVVLKTRRLLTHWRTVFGALLGLFLALSFYLYLPVASMTVPPANWGNARTVEGFVHLITRGQYERIDPMDVAKEPGRCLQAVWGYSRETARAMSFIYVLPAFIPWFFLRKMQGSMRAWMLGLCVIFLSLSLFMLVMLNPPPDRAAWSFVMLYFLGSHLVLTVFSGYGLVLLGTFASRARRIT